MKARKILSILVLVAVLGLNMLCAPVFASEEAPATAEPVQYKIVIHPAETSDTSDPERFSMYQITSGIVTDTVAVEEMAAVTWGIGINSQAFFADVEDEQAFEEPLASILNYYDQDEGLGDMSGIVSILLHKNEDMNEALASIAADHIVQPYGWTRWDSAAGAWTFTTTQPGLYLMVDTYMEPVYGGADDKASPFILAITGDMDLSIVSYTPELEKTANYSENSFIDTGSGVTYDVTGYLPGDYADYESFRLVFHETADPGITINENTVTVTIDREKIKGGEDTYTVEKTENADGSTSLDIIFPDVKSGTLGVLSGSSSIKISYKATVTGAMKAGVEKHCYSQLEYPTELDGAGTGYSARVDGSICTLGMEFHTDPGGTYVLMDFLGNYAVLEEMGGAWQVTKWRDEAKDATMLDVPSDGVLRFSGLGCSVYALHELAAPVGLSATPDVLFSTDIITDELGEPGSLVAEIDETGYAAISSEPQDRVFSITLAHKQGVVAPIPVQQEDSGADMGAENTPAPAAENASLTGDNPKAFIPIVICCGLAAAGYIGYKIWQFSLSKRKNNTKH